MLALVRRARFAAKLLPAKCVGVPLRWAAPDLIRDPTIASRGVRHEISKNHLSYRAQVNWLGRWLGVYARAYPCGQRAEESRGVRYDRWFLFITFPTPRG